MSLYGGFFNLLIRLLGFLPYKFLYYLGKALACLLYVIPNAHKTVSFVNLNQVFPNKSKKEIKTLLRESLFHSVMNLLESGLVWGNKNYINQEGFIDVLNFESIKRSLAEKKGLILFTPHIGNIEILINFLGRNSNCTIPYTKPKNKYLDKIITKSRNDAGVKMVNTDSRGIKEILIALREKNLVAVASDQVPKDGAGIISVFFDNEIYSMTLLPKLQQKIRCNVHLMFCQRKPKGAGFIINFKDPLDLTSGIQYGVDKMNKEIEKCIMEAPEQYSWEYKKFKRTRLKSIY